jgi:ATP-dependent DNA helicase RecG
MIETNRIELKQELSEKLEKEVIAFLNFRKRLPEALNQEEFFEGVSIPRNKELMRIFKDLDMVEQLGSGVPRILDYYNKNCFKFSEHFLRMTFPIDIDIENTIILGGQIGGQMGGQIDGAMGGAIEKSDQILELTQRQNEVLDVLRQENKISRSAIAKQLNINESAVLKHLEMLKQKGYIERIGGTRGFWKINNNGSND